MLGSQEQTQAILLATEAQRNSESKIQNINLNRMILC